MKPFEFAILEIDTEEKPGILHNDRILQYSKEIGATWVKSDEVAWCAIFTQWCLKQAKMPYSYHANARYFVNYGKSTLEPKLGDLAVLWRGSKTGTFGHVGFYIKKDKKYIWILGGNQSNKVCIQKYPIENLIEFRSI